MCFSTFFFFCTNLFEKSCIKIEKWGNDKVESVFETSGTVLIVHLPVDLDHPVSDDIRRESDRIIGRQYIKNMVLTFQRPLLWIAQESDCLWEGTVHWECGENVYR